MRNIPRIFIDAPLSAGKQIPLTPDVVHYLTKVMRVSMCNYDFIVFNNGDEFYAELKSDGKLHFALCKLHTNRPDPSNNLTFAFAPIKQSRMEEMLNMATQMGVAKLQPVITDHTTERFPKWERIRKIITEASEQSGRNSVPELLPEIRFREFQAMCNLQSAKCNLVFADERFARSKEHSNNCTLHFANCTLLIGPEGGFSDSEFVVLDAAGAIGMSLGKTILRAETAAVAAIAKLI